MMERENVREKIEELYKRHRARLLGYIDEKKIRGEDTKETLRGFEEVLSGKFLEDEEGLLEVRKLVQAEVLFYGPLRRTIRFQTRLDERAAKELLE